MRGAERLAYRQVSLLGSCESLISPKYSIQIARGDVVEHEHAVLEVALGEDLLDAGLATVQKVEGGVELVLVDLAQAEHGAERVGGGRLAELARGRELRACRGCLAAPTTRCYNGGR